MAAKQKKNIYEGRVKFSINGQSADEVGQEYISAVVIDWFVRSMFRCCRDKPGYEGLERWEYSGIDCEKYKKTKGDDKK